MQRAKNGKRSPRAAIASRGWGTIVRVIRTVRCGRRDGGNRHKEGRRQGGESASSGPANTVRSRRGLKVSRRAWSRTSSTVGRWLAGRRRCDELAAGNRMAFVGPYSKTGLHFGRGPRRRSPRVGNYCTLDRLPSRSHPRTKIALAPPNGGSNVGRPTRSRCPLRSTMVRKVSPRDKVRSITAHANSSNIHEHQQNTSTTALRLMQGSIVHGRDRAQSGEQSDTSL